nr:hypothetical protein [Gammaproteobacteria bacterium]
IKDIFTRVGYKFSAWGVEDDPHSGVANLLMPAPDPKSLKLLSGVFANLINKNVSFNEISKLLNLPPEFLTLYQSKLLQHSAGARAYFASSEDRHYYLLTDRIPWGKLRKLLQEPIKESCWQAYVESRGLWQGFKDSVKRATFSLGFWVPNILLFAGGLTARGVTGSNFALDDVGAGAAAVLDYSVLYFVLPYFQRAVELVSAKHELFSLPKEVRTILTEFETSLQATTINFTQEDLKQALLKLMNLHAIDPQKHPVYQPQAKPGSCLSALKTRVWSAPGYSFLTLVSAAIAGFAAYEVAPVLANWDDGLNESFSKTVIEVGGPIVATISGVVLLEIGRRASLAAKTAANNLTRIVNGVSSMLFAQSKPVNKALSQRSSEPSGAFLSV